MKTIKEMAPARWYHLMMIFLISCSPPPSKDEVTLSMEFAPAGTYPVPHGTHSELGLAGYAKVLCSALFVSGRKLDEAMKNSGVFLLPEEDRDQVSFDVNQETKVVTLTLRDSIVRKAKFWGDQGCIICRDNEEKVYFETEEVQTNLPDAMSQPWPMGDLTEENIPEGVDMDIIREATALAFEDNEGLTAAYLVVYRGQIIAERYMDGIGRETQLESWSMGKSLTATLIARLIHRGDLTLDQPAPIPIWQKSGDPRGKIRIRDLLQMSSGLKFTSHRDPDVEELTPYLDHIYIYTGAVDVYEYSTNRPLQFVVGSTGRYRNCDPLILGYIMKLTLEDRDQSYLGFAQKELFDKIGIRKQVMETDPYGNFLLTGYDYGTARNWARIGLLYLQDGVWNDERLLPEGWVDFVSSPAPGWEEPVYGGQFWLNRTGVLPIPDDAFYAAGGGGQRTIIIPSMDLVVVRLGHFQGSAIGMEDLNKSLTKLMQAF